MGIIRRAYEFIVAHRIYGIRHWIVKVQAADTEMGRQAALAIVQHEIDPGNARPTFYLLSTGREM